jgi:hypothetical protein
MADKYKISSDGKFLKIYTPEGAEIKGCTEIVIKGRSDGSPLMAFVTLILIEPEFIAPIKNG